MERPVILIVDDEPYTADALRRLFRLEPVNVEVANSGDEAKPLLEQHPISLAIVDYFMPGITGIELINWIKENHPGVTCFLLSGQANIQSILLSMEQKNIERTFTKPWNNEEMLQAALAVLKDKGAFPV